MVVCFEACYPRTVVDSHKGTFWKEMDVRHVRVIISSYLFRSSFVLYNTTDFDFNLIRVSHCLQLIVYPPISGLNSTEQASTSLLLKMQTKAINFGTYFFFSFQLLFHRSGGHRYMLGVSGIAWGWMHML